MNLLKRNDKKPAPEPLPPLDEPYPRISKETGEALYPVTARVLAQALGGHLAEGARSLNLFYFADCPVCGRVDALWIGHASGVAAPVFDCRRGCEHPKVHDKLNELGLTQPRRLPRGAAGHSQYEMYTSGEPMKRMAWSKSKGGGK